MRVIIFSLFIVAVFFGIGYLIYIDDINTQNYLINNNCILTGKTKTETIPMIQYIPIDSYGTMMPVTYFIDETKYNYSCTNNPNYWNSRKFDITQAQK